jgi:hypothetical protein
VISSLHKQKIGDKMMEFNNIIINEIREQDSYYDRKANKHRKYKTPKKTITPVIRVKYANLEETLRELTIASDRVKEYGGKLEVKFELSSDLY